MKFNSISSSAYFQSVCPERHSYLLILHSLVHTKSDRNSQERKKKEARGRSSNPGSFLTSAQLTNHGMKWVWMSDCLYRKVPWNGRTRPPSPQGGGFSSYLTIRQEVLVPFKAYPEIQPLKLRERLELISLLWMCFSLPCYKVLHKGTWAN